MNFREPLITLIIACGFLMVSAPVSAPDIETSILRIGYFG